MAVLGESSTSSVPPNTVRLNLGLMAIGELSLSLSCSSKVSLLLVPRVTCKRMWVVDIQLQELVHLVYTDENI